MARPLRRVCIGLSLKTGKDVEEIERWPISKIREYMAVICEPPDPKAKVPQGVPVQSDDDLKAAFAAVAGIKPKE